MANYALVANSVFQPFTYQELAAPLDRQELYHEKLAEEYDQLSKQADVLEILGENDLDKDSGSYSRYSSFSDSLRKEADDLYRYGLNTESRRRLSDLKRKYNSVIVPIQAAYTKREKEADEQLKASLQNPSLRFTRDARSTGIDDYVNNPMGGYGVVDLDKVSADMSKMAGNLAKQKREGRKEGIDAYTYNLISPYGLDPNLVRDWANNPDVSPTLTNMMHQVLRAQGIDNEDFLHTPNGARIMQEAIGAAQRGAWSAVGEDKEHILESYGARLAAQEAKEKRVAKYSHNLQQPPSGGGIAINPINIYSKKEIQKADNAYTAYSQYFDRRPDGSYVLNNAGKKEYNREVDNWKSANGAGSYKSKEKSPFRVFIDSKMTGGVNDPGLAWQNFVNTQPTNQFDATRVTEFDYTIADSQQKEMKGAIQTASRGIPLKEVDYNEKQGRFISTGDKLTLQNLNSDKYTVLSTRFSPYGNTVMVKDDKGDVHRYEMPAGINPTNERNRDAAMLKAVQLQSVIASGKYVSKDGIEHTLSEDEMWEAQKQYREALQEAYMYHSQLGVSNKTKEQEFNPYGY